MKQIQLHLIPSLIIERAKNETYLKGKIDKVTQQNAEPLAYNEQMGDEIFHERKAQAALIAGLESLPSASLLLQIMPYRTLYQKQTTHLILFCMLPIDLTTHIPKVLQR